MNNLIPRTLAAAVAAAALLAAAATPAGAQAWWFEGHPRQAAFSVQPERTRVVVSPMGRAYLGVVLINITEELRSFYGAPADAGVLVSRVAEDSPAAAAGFAVGDVITRVGDEPVEFSREVVRAVAGLEPGDTVAVEVIQGGAPRTLNPVLSEREGSVWFSADFEMPELEELRVLREELPRVVIESEAAREAAQRAFEIARERLRNVDLADLAERLAETEERLRELERKLSEKER